MEALRTQLMHGQLGVIAGVFDDEDADGPGSRCATFGGSAGFRSWQLTELARQFRSFGHLLFPSACYFSCILGGSRPGLLSSGTGPDGVSGVNNALTEGERGSVCGATMCDLRSGR